MNPFFLTADPAAPNFLGTYGILIVACVAMYFILFLPQKRQEKKAQEMRADLQVGDGVTTIGGIVGRVVSVKDDTVLIETGSERTKIRFKRIAIQSVEKLDMD